MQSKNDLNPPLISEFLSNKMKKNIKWAICLSSKHQFIMEKEVFCFQDQRVLEILSINFKIN